MPIKDASKQRVGHSPRNRKRGRKPKKLAHQEGYADTTPKHPIRSKPSLPKDPEALANKLFEGKQFLMNLEIYDEWGRDTLLWFAAEAVRNDREDLAVDAKRLLDQLDRQYKKVPMKGKHYEAVSKSFRLDW